MQTSFKGQEDAGIPRIFNFIWKNLSWRAHFGDIPRAGSRYVDRRQPQAARRQGAAPPGETQHMGAPPRRRAREDARRRAPAPAPRTSQPPEVRSRRLRDQAPRRTVKSHPLGGRRRHRTPV
uniref:Uncharacterized protein n=1 Tax=Steinernema glaseri TaxID=37863 RepID=A0A1I8A6Y1_9BILA